MPLRCPRFSGDKVLEDCLRGQHRMFSGEEGLAVKRVQAALIELGYSVGPAGADGIFGTDTGTAVSAYKFDKGLVPSDPVVGRGTAKALDDDLFSYPPELDPAFAEFSPAVVDRQVEPFVALELAALIGAPLNSWRHMLARFALAKLNSRQFLGMVATSRREDLRARYLAVAAPMQSGGVSADVWFDGQTSVDLANTVTFFLPNGETSSLVVVNDDVILGRRVIVRQSTGEKAPVTLLGVVLHELTHVRNLANKQLLLATPDTDGATYADVPLAQARTAAGKPTVEVLKSFVEEMCARHVHWIVLKEVAGTPGAISSLSADQLAAAVLWYFIEGRPIYDSNGYGGGINAQGDAMRFQQLELWLKRCHAHSFSDKASEEARTKALFGGAATWCADQLVTPTFNFPLEDGLFPLAADFH